MKVLVFNGGFFSGEDCHAGIASPNTDGTFSGDANLKRPSPMPDKPIINPGTSSGAGVLRPHLNPFDLMSSTAAQLN